MADEPASTNQPETPETPKTEGPANVPEVDPKVIQAAEDRVRTKYSKEVKELREMIDALKTEKMSAKEKAEFEAEKLKQDLDRKEKELTIRELKLIAAKELEKEGLPLEFMDHVIGTDADATLGKIALMKKTFDAAVANAADARIKAQGRDPNKGRDGTGQTSDIAGMTPEMIQKKTREDPKWFEKHEQEILAAVGDGKYNKK